MQNNRVVKVPIPDELKAELVHPEDGFKSANSHDKVEWQCSEGHRWMACIASRTRSHSGCPYCSGRLPVVGENDLATTHPDIARQLLHPELAKTVGAGSAQKLEWVCDVNPEHIWEAPVRNRVGTKNHKATGCPICANRSAKRQDTRLPTLGAVQHELLAEALYPEEVAKLSCGSGVKVLWVCEKHGTPYIYEMPVRKRVRNRQGCPVCAGRRIVRGINDFATTHPELAQELVDPSDGFRYSRGSDAKVRWQCGQGHVWEAMISSRVSGNGCPECALLGTSEQEKGLARVLEMLAGSENVVFHDQSILSGRYEIDAVVPSRHIAIEFNGLYWHSTQAGKDAKYHQMKLQAAEAVGYQLLQIWEDDWVCNRDVVIRLLAAKLGATDRLSRVMEHFDAKYGQRYGARMLSAGELDPALARDFLDENHIQGHVAATRHFGLMSKDNIVAVMSVRAPQARSQVGCDIGEWEIQRYATCGVVVGGFSKLLAYAEKQLLEEGCVLTKWVSFSSNDISNGAMYEKCGFVVQSEYPPDYSYVGRATNNKRVPKRRFQKKTFRNNSRFVWDESWTESEAAAKNGLLKVFDSGKKKWVKSVG